MCIHCAWFDHVTSVRTKNIATSGQGLTGFRSNFTKHWWWCGHWCGATGLGINNATDLDLDGCHLLEARQVDTPPPPAWDGELETILPMHNNYRFKC